MKKAIITTLAILTMATSQALPMADTFTSSLSDTAITVSAADYEPAKVTGLSAKRSYTTATISWDNVSKAKGYRVYVYDTAAKKYKKLTTIKKNSTTSYQIKGLKAGTSYKFKVRAYRKANGKTYWGKSGAISVTTKSYAPAKVKGVTAKANSKTAGTLTWTKIANAKGYRVYIYNTATKKYKKVITLSGNDKTSYKVTGLTAGTSYKFKVRAYRKVDSKTYWGKPSAAVTLTTKGGTTSSAAVDKAYQSLIVGNSTAEQRELIRQDLIAYVKRTHPEYTFDERIYAMVDANGKPTTIMADAVETGNSCWASGIDADDEITDYYVFGKSLSSLAKTFRNDCYDIVEHDIYVWNMSNIKNGIKPSYDRFNIIIYLCDDNSAIKYNTGKDLPSYVIITPVSNKLLIES